MNKFRFHDSREGKGRPAPGAGETFIRNFGTAIGADHEVSEKDEVITPEHSNILYIIMIAEKARMVLHPRCCGKHLNHPQATLLCPDSIRD